MFFRKKKKRMWPYVLLFVIVVLFGFGWYAYGWISSLDPLQVFSQPILREQINKRIGPEYADLFDLAPYILGFDEPRTALILFLNDTELRPGGGFIGSYALVRIDKGRAELLSMQGSEILDKNADLALLPVPPEPIEKYMGVGKWFFRDSNWSPDFSVNARKALDLYTLEGGLAAGDIDMVFGITTHVLEEVLHLSGPLTVEGITFEADKAVETLEYEVEYGYKERGIAFENRKDIMRPLMSKIMEYLSSSVFSDEKRFLVLFDSLVRQKYIMAYVPDPALQKKFVSAGLGAQTASDSGDYLQWIDANLAALKTDHALERKLSYHFTKQDEGSYIAAASMKYVHKGSFDWRTSRYRTYARVFVPPGSYVSSLYDSDGRVLSHDEIDQGEEDGKQWFGAFLSIEPGQTKELTFVYGLPVEVKESIEKGLYTLIVQKQAGAGSHSLTLDLDFDTTIKAAEPPETEDKWNDDHYTLDTNLEEDRRFEVRF